MIGDEDFDFKSFNSLLRSRTGYIKVDEASIPHNKRRLLEELRCPHITPEERADVFTLLKEIKLREDVDTISTHSPWG